MTEGIAKAIEMENSEKYELFFISIVADDIDLIPQLSVLSDETTAPILIAASKHHYTEDEHFDALNSGADFYGAYSDTPEKNIEAVLSAINSIDRRAKKKKAPNGVLAHGDILLVAHYHKVFVRDVEIKLTASEMKIFHYLMLNRGNTLLYRQIFHQISDDFFDELTADSLYSAVKRLRQKLRDATGIDFIETVKDVGYRLKAKAERLI
jgi:two-component system OmpR family response regulator